MKNIIPLLLLFTTLTMYSQNKINYEQRAFEYFRDSILKTKKSKISVVREILDIRHILDDTKCLKNYDLEARDTVASKMVTLPAKVLDFSKDKRLKEGTFHQESFLIVVGPCSRFEKNGKYIVPVITKNMAGSKKYLIEMDEMGNVKSWCK